MDERAITRQFERVAREGQDACQELERGQALTPLSDHFAEILGDLDDRVFSIAVLGITREARTAALSWLYGSEFGMLSVHMPEDVGLVEIRLSERGFVLETAAGQHEEFDQLGAFFDALKGADLVRTGDANSWIDPVKLQVNSSTGVRSLRIFMPESLASFKKNPSLLGRLTLNANLLAIVAPNDWRASDDEQRILGELAEGMEVVWPIVHVDNLEERATSSGWWSSGPVREARACLPVTRIADTGGPTLPDFLSEERDPVRRAMTFTRHAHRYERAADALGERHEHEMRQLKSRKAREERKSSGGARTRGPDPAIREGADRVKSALQDELQSLERGLKELTRKASLPEGELTRVVEDVLDNLTLEDIHQEPGHKMFKLSVDSELLDHLSLQIKKALKRRMRQDLVLLRDGLQAHREQAEQQASDAQGVALSLELPPPDEGALWDTLKEMLAVRIRYSGELPKRSFVARLGEGRRSVFMILMSLSIVGSIIGVNLRQAQWLGGVFLVVFIGSFVWTFRSWKAEDEARLGKEVAKVRETLRTEANRLINEVEREKGSRVNEHLDRLKKSTLKDIDSAFKGHQRAHSDAADLEKDQAKERQKQVDAKLRDAQSFQQRLSRLGQTVSELERDCQSGLRDLLREMRDADRSTGA